MNALMFSLNLLGGLAVFLYGMRVMSEALQKAAGDRLRQLLHSATNNRFIAVISGFLVTCAVQSSSATTVMIVGFSSAGLLTLSQSLGLIFGANIGTTTTGWIVSLLGFKVKITQFALPLIGIGFFSQFVRKWRFPHRIGEILVGFGLLFLGLHLIKESIPNLQESPMVQGWLNHISSEGFGPLLMAVLLGTVLTMIFQSSSAMMAVTLAAAASGLIDFRTSSALVLGENIGTTITANLASIGSPVVARRAARGHFFFNVFGVLWMLAFFSPFIKLVDWIVPGDPYGTTQNSLLVAIPTHIAAFHTMFNLTNTLIFLPLLSVLEKFIYRLVPDDEKDGEPDLRYISTPLSSTPELAIAAAQKEVDYMASVVVRMIKKIITNLKGDQNHPSIDVNDILQDEKKTDVLEHKINEYLAALTHAHLSSASNKQVLSFLSMINDLERMGDHGEKIALLFNRAATDKNEFSQDGIKDLQTMAKKTLEIAESMKHNIIHQNGDPMPDTIKRENQLNSLRDQIRSTHIKRITSGKCTPYTGIIFADILTSFEKMGDHAFNVVEASVGIK